MSLSDESLFREVDEEVRRQKVQDLWNRWGNLFVAISVAVIVLVAGYKGWQYWEHKRSEEAARAYFAAIDLASQGKSDEAAKKFGEITSGGHKGYGFLARMNMAAELAAAGKTSEAVKAYDEIAAASSAEPNLRNAARIRAALLLIDTASREEITRRLADLNKPENVWRNEAREILALAAYRVNDYTEADRLMNEVVLDQESPPNLRQRAQVMISLLAPHLGENKPAVQ
jgi:hypothetical protein